LGANFGCAFILERHGFTIIKLDSTLLIACCFKVVFGPVYFELIKRRSWTSGIEKVNFLKGSFLNEENLRFLES